MVHEHSHLADHRHSDDQGPAARRAEGHGQGHSHGHGHAHGHSHVHAHGHGVSERRLLLTLCILLTFTAVEALGGWLANSIALLAEAGHMLADSGSLLLAVLAIRASRRPADARHTYGSGRYQTLAAYTNGLLLLALTAWVMTEAVRRLIAPPTVDGRLMLIIALIGGVANLAALVILAGASSLNERGARAHVFSDLLGSAAAAIAAVSILELGWRIADPILSILVSLLILRSGWALTREAGHVLLQGTPAALDPDDLARDLAQVSGVTEVHHLHVWSLTGEAPVVTLHATIDPLTDPQAALQGMLSRLRERHGTAHATIQIEGGRCLDSEGHPCHRA
ncbi:MAG TPA: cation diffusion facilitator family transporter [Steroidobacteraceae bacterium]|nr:cation diffusion facilitator family transporter [Steroidobacteraceae bacterium]